MARTRSRKESKVLSTQERRERRKLPIDQSAMVELNPLTDNQGRIFNGFDEGKNLFIYGCAGTGKTFCALYKALQAVLSPTSTYDSIYLVRSLVATREIGFLPGSHEDKSDIYQIPYKNMVKYMFERETDEQFEMLYSQLQAQNTIKFWSTSFLRGVTLDNSIVIIDEMQNLNFHELDSIITRVGENTRIVFAGDAVQSDLIKDRERNGIHDFMRILEMMPDDFALIEMGIMTDPSLSHLRAECLQEPIECDCFW